MTITLPRKLEQEVQRHAKARGITETEFVRTTLQVALRARAQPRKMTKREAIRNVLEAEKEAPIRVDAVAYLKSLMKQR